MEYRGDPGSEAGEGEHLQNQPLTLETGRGCSRAAPSSQSWEECIRWGLFGVGGVQRRAGSP